jgi:hypothetical protein
MLSPPLVLAERGKRMFKLLIKIMCPFARAGIFTFTYFLLFFVLVYSIFRDLISLQLIYLSVESVDSSHPGAEEGPKG